MKDLLLFFHPKRMWDSPTFTTWGSFFSKSVSLLIVSALIISRLSAGEIAVWFLFASIISFSFIFDLGFAPTFIRLVSFIHGGSSRLDRAEPADPTLKGQIDWPLMKRLYTSMGLIYLVLGIVIFILLGSVGTLVLMKQISGLESPTEAWIAWAFVILFSTMSFYGNKYDAVLKGFNQITLVNRYNTLFNLIGGISQVAVLLLGGGLLELVITRQFWIAFNMYRNRMLVKGMMQGQFKEFRGITIDHEILHFVWPSAWRTGIIVLGSQTIAHLSGIIYAQYASAVEVATLLFSMRMMAMVSEFSWAPFYSKLPVYSRMRVEGDQEGIYRLACDGIRKSLLFFLFCALLTGLLADPLLHLIESNTAFVSGKLWALMIAAVFFERHQAMHSQIVMSANVVPFHIPVLFTSVIFVISLYFAIPVIGMWGPVACQLVSGMFILNWYSVRLSLDSLNKTFGDYFRRYLIYPALFLFASVLITFFWA